LERPQSALHRERSVHAQFARRSALKQGMPAYAIALHAIHEGYDSLSADECAIYDAVIAPALLSRAEKLKTSPVERVRPPAALRRRVFERRRATGLSKICELPTPSVGNLYTTGQQNGPTLARIVSGRGLMKMRIAVLSSTALSLCLSVSMASAGIINSPVPSNAYITQSGLNWAWAFPCPGLGGAGHCGDGSAVDFTYQGTQGWRFPTLAELAIAPTVPNFLFAGANVPAGGTDVISTATFFGANPLDGACATPYFSSSYHWCDYSNGQGGGDGLSWASPGDASFAEQLVVRDAPEPSTLALIAAGLLSLCGLGLMRRRSDA